jgi:hypothetical protein
MSWVCQKLAEFETDAEELLPLLQTTAPSDQTDRGVDSPLS